jgi:hypothetical protein
VRSRSTTCAIAAIAIACACKTRGTITLDFDNAIPCDAPPSDARGDDAGPGPDAGEYVVVYARDRTTCADCTCGNCFGRDTQSSSACDDAADRCTLDSIHEIGVDLNLGPGQWAVVLDRYHLADNLLFANRCIDVTVDSDGTSTKTAEPTVCEASCSQ